MTRIHAVPDRDSALSNQHGHDCIDGVEHDHATAEHELRVQAFAAARVARPPRSGHAHSGVQPIVA